MGAMTPDRKAGMRLAWCANEKLDAIAAAFDTSRGRLCNLAKAEGWPPRPKKPPQLRWKGEMLAKLEAAWRTDSRPRHEIALSFGTDVSRAYQLARKYQWPRDRRAGRRAELSVVAP